MTRPRAKLALSLALAAALGATASQWAIHRATHEAPAPAELASMSGHGFELAAGSDPMLTKVSDSGASPFASHDSFADIVEASAPSVVLVRVQKRPDAASPEEDEEGSLLDFLRRFGTPRESIPGSPGPKGMPKAPAPKGAPKAPEEGFDDAPPSPDANTAPTIPFPKAPAKPPLSGGVGSGFFIDAQGYALTNAHVVEGASKIMLRLSDRREIEAHLVGLDHRTDIALIKADGTGFKPLPIGNPAKARVGDWVLAIGSPFGLEFTTTAGILSAKERSLPTDDNYLPFLQTDAAVNPGNSGGPLINARGQAIGINSQIYSRSGGYMGISFAIPIDYAIKIAGKLRRDGSVRHGRIGAYVQELTPELADAFGMPGKSGAIILSVEPGSAADKAGLAPADIITSFGGRAIAGSNEMVRLIADRDPGDTISVGLLRDGKPMSATMVLGGAPDASTKPDAKDKASESVPEPSKPSANEPLGLKARPLSEREAKAAKVSQGLKVLEADGLAESDGIEAGDIILSVDNRQVASVQELSSIVAKAAPGKPLAILIKRGQTSRYLAVTP